MEEPTQQITWASIIALALSSGIVASVVTQGLSTWREFYSAKQDRKRDATYLAIRVAVILEQFAIDCASYLGDFETERRSGGINGMAHTKLPTLQEYPEALSWTSIDNELCERMLSFRTETRNGQNSIRGISDIDPSLGPEVCEDECALLGHRAWVLARDLRLKHKLPEFRLPNNDWDFVGNLKRACDKVVRNREGDFKRS